MLEGDNVVGLSTYHALEPVRTSLQIMLGPYTRIREAASTARYPNDPISRTIMLARTARQSALCGLIYQKQMMTSLFNQGVGPAWVCGRDADTILLQSFATGIHQEIIDTRIKMR